MRTNKLLLAKHSLIVLFFQNEYKYEAMIRRHFTTKIVLILIFLFVKRGDNRHLSSASKQKWQNGYPISERIWGENAYKQIAFS
jgi:hypothetical protein